MREHGTKTTPVFLPPAGEASWSLLPSSVSLLSGGTTIATRKRLFLYPHSIGSNLQIAQNGRFIINPVYLRGGTLVAKILYLRSLKA